MHFYTDHSKHKERFLKIRMAMRMRIRDGHADAGRMPIRKMRRYYRTISDICRIMRISASMRIRKYIRMANPNVKHARRAQSPRLLVVLMISMMMISWRANYHGVGEMSP